MRVFFDILISTSSINLLNYVSFDRWKWKSMGEREIVYINDTHVKIYKNFLFTHNLYTVSFTPVS